MDRLIYHARPEMDDARMVLGLSGWMDGGEVSTGTLRYLAETLGARPLADIEPRGFYIYNFPGSMEISALFRPHVELKGGLVRSYQPPENRFTVAEAERLILFSGKEPNLDWESFADAIFEVAAAFDVRTLYFLGSYAGVVPHTRDPRLYCSVSDESLKGELADQGLRFSDYSGPAGFSTYLTTLAAGRGRRMATVVAEIPAYVQGGNPRCIEAMARTIGAILGVQVDLGPLRSLSDAFESRVTDAMQERPELVEMVQKMEAAYDSELFETQMGDFRQWLEQQGIRFD